MAVYIQYLTLDINPSAAPAVVSVKQDDVNSRDLYITLTQDGQQFNLSSSGVYSAMFRMRKPDNTVVTLSGTINTSYNRVQVRLSQQTLVVAGRGYADLALIDSQNTVISTIPFIISIVASPEVAAKAVSSDEFAYFLSFIQDASNIIAQARSWATAAENSKNQIANMTATIAMIDTNEAPRVTKTEQSGTFNLFFEIPYAHAAYVTFDIDYTTGNLYMFRPINSQVDEEITFALNEETGNLEVIFNDGQ